MKPGQYKRVFAKNKEFIDQFCNSHKYIYRYLPLERCLETLQTGYFVFVSPTLWKDPFDNFLFRQEVNDDSIVRKLYVCCFTMNSHSQAYWKNYAENGHCVRLRIRTREFFDFLLSRDEKISFGRMKYVRESTLIEKLRNTAGLKKAIQLDRLSDTFLTTFHFKRLPFKFEDEMRVIIDATSSEGNLKRLKVDLQTLINDIYLDPRIEKHEEAAWKEYLKRFSIPVKKSLLFNDKKVDIQ